MDGKKIGVLLVQIGYDKNPGAVLEKAEKMIDEAMEENSMVDVVLLPELYYSGEKEAFLDTYKRLAKKYNVNIITGSMPVERGDRKPLNTTFVIDREGNVLGDYSKVHLFDAYDDKESDRYGHGDKLGIFDLDIGRVGIIICYDIRFSEYIRTLALKGIELLLIPAAFYRPRGDEWEILLKGSALTNIMYVCAANQFGKRCAGRSSVIDPNGQIIAKASDRECCVHSVIDMGFEKEMRERNPLFDNRRPEMYDIGDNSHCR